MLVLGIDLVSVEIWGSSENLRVAAALYGQNVSISIFVVEFRENPECSVEEPYVLQSGGRHGVGIVGRRLVGLP